mgnify:CR=1 FL=1
MYLATLGPQKSLLSTYFIANLDDVGGGGTHKKARAKNTGKKQSNKTLSFPTTFALDGLKELVTSERLDLISPVFTDSFI